LLDDADAIASKIRRARTDPEPLPETLEGLAERPEADNLVGIYAAMASLTKGEVLSQYAGKGFGDFKPALADLLVERLAPVSARMRAYMDDPAEIDRILAAGAAKARALAAPVLAETKRLVGFVDIG
jgi:tryptophanyl-tRNA synthetase